MRLSLAQTETLLTTDLSISAGCCCRGCAGCSGYAGCVGCWGSVGCRGCRC